MMRSGSRHGATGHSDYLDAWKGWAIVAVVAIHVSAPAFQYPPGSFNFEFGLIFRQFLTFAVPLFFALSGYFSAKHEFESWREVRKFWGQRLQRLLPAYTVWTVIYLVVFSPRDLVGLGLVKDYLLGTGIGIGYFVIVLAQFVVLTPAISRIRSKRYLVCSMILITGFALIVNYVVRAGYPESIWARFPYYVIFFPIWYLFYALGLLLGRIPERKGPPSSLCRTLLWAAVVAGVGLSIVEAEIWASMGNVDLAASQNKATNYVAAAALISLVLIGRRQGGIPFMAMLGTFSYPIFLMHMLVLKCLRPWVDHAFFAGNQPAYLLVVTALTLSICVGVVVVARRWMPAKLARATLGL